MITNNHGTCYYDDDNKLHREDGPAKINKDGYTAWYIHGKLHRIDGPAQYWPGRYQVWSQNGKYHRKDGPAMEWFDSNINKFEYWFNGVKFDCSSTEEFLKMIKWKAFW
jgi:hypothetical protein